ncbi:MAG: MotA/TolQ/ExbB proton channel family protein [Proteobacteria bacterium]|nr:MotA/TolQ/ExbB proton channel family protein [Pseudomonadota bacterium]
MATMSVWIIIERLIYFSRLKLNDFSREDTLELALTRYLSMLSALASNAPYVGLLGTVLGIMMALYEVGMSGQLEPSKIMVGLALALKATAMGIGLAIIGMFAVNLLMRRVDAIKVTWRVSQHAH